MQSSSNKNRLALNGLSHVSSKPNKTATDLCDSANLECLDTTNFCSDLCKNSSCSSLSILLVKRTNSIDSHVSFFVCVFASQLFAAYSPPRGVLWTLSVVVNLLLSLTGKPLVLIEIQFLNVVFCSLSFGKPSFFPIGSHLIRFPL